MKVSELLKFKLLNKKVEGDYITGNIRKDNKLVKVRVSRKAYNEAIKEKNEATKTKNEIIRMKNIITKFKNEYIKVKNEIIKANKKYDEIIKNYQFRAQIFVTAEIDISITTIFRRVNVNLWRNTENDDNYDVFTYNDIIIEACTNYSKKFGGKFVQVIDKKPEINFYNTNDDEYNIKFLNKKMFKVSPLNIKYLFNQEIDMNTDNNSCVLDYIINTYKSKWTKKHIIKTFNKFTEYKTYNDYVKGGVSCNELINFCLCQKIGLYIYDINAKLIYKNIYENRSGIKNLIIVSHDNHMYISKNKTLERQHTLKYKDEIKYIKNDDNDLKPTLTNLIKDNKCIENICISSGGYILNFVSEGTLYKHEN